MDKIGIIGIFVGGVLRTQEGMSRITKNFKITAEELKEIERVSPMCVLREKSHSGPCFSHLRFNPK